MKILTLIAWTLVCIYLGFAGWARVQSEQKIEISSTAGPDQVQCGEEITFGSLEDCLMYEREKQTSALFPWVFNIPSFFGVIIVSIFFGSLGGVIKVLKEITLDKLQISRMRASILPFFGGLMGLIILGISILVPDVISANEIVVRPTTLLFLTMFGGAFSDKAFSWADAQMTRIFSLPNNGAE
ncbi:MAG: hypothetical protein R3211_11225 [Balneolaceae bacterium]|nr:hypothetical protein [Balneolaceae bacterium]